MKDEGANNDHYSAIISMTSNNQIVELGGDYPLLEESFQNNFETPNKKCKRLTSNCWRYFERSGLDDKGVATCQCKGCGRKLSCRSSGGTSHLNRHISICKNIRKHHDMGVRHDQSTKLRDRKIDQKVARDLLVQMIIRHNLPFQCVEWQEFRELCNNISNGQIVSVSRNTITADVMKVYAFEKEKLKDQLKRIEGRVCLTADFWTTGINGGYMTLSAHFTDENWKLNSKLLNFCHLEPPHTGHVLSNKVLGLLKDWGIDEKVFSITLRNANATVNDNMQRLLRNELCLSNSLLHDGEYFHIRCCAPILDLIVQEGLNIAHELLHNIRESIKYVNSSEVRLNQFNRLMMEVGGIDNSIALCLDVPTIWNTTYLMLESALRYNRVFVSLSLNDKNFKHCPSSEDWSRGEKVCDFLQPFYEFSNIMSKSTYPTSNLYFMLIWKIELLLKTSLFSDDDMIKDMTSKMIDKFEIYWKEYSMILAFGCILDPRMKVNFLRYAYSKLEASSFIIEEKIDNTVKALKKLFDDYANKNVSTSNCDTFTSTQTYGKIGSMKLSNIYDDFEEENQEFFGKEKSPLDLYLDEPKLVGHKDLNVLEYWKERSLLYNDLARMASDILSIPITTVTAESSFCIGGHTLNNYRNSLISSNLEARICTKNWLFGFSPDDELENSEE